MFLVFSCFFGPIVIINVLIFFIVRQSVVQVHRKVRRIKTVSSCGISLRKRISSST